jgi:hypothetical protein
VRRARRGGQDQPTAPRSDTAELARLRDLARSIPAKTERAQHLIERIAVIAEELHRA